MANGVKTYQIKIDGIDKSIDAVKSLEKELFNLEQRIAAVSKQAVSVKTSGGGGSSRASAISTLSEEEAIQRELNKLKEEGARLDAKIVATQDEIYKRVDATKQLYKEVVADQKALAAQERLQANTYNTNTMQGMKERLADLKAVINTTDISDTGTLQKLTQEANELNEKLKELEATYGQFGRNVENYKSAVEGFSVVIGNTTAQFNSAKQAAKELDKEMKTLSAKKDQGIISEDELERLKELIPVVAQLKSSINDAGKPMDALMDSMQSVVALTQVGKGLSAFFGIDNTEVEKSIKNLVALQSALSGLQEIQKQMNELQGFGEIFTKGGQNIDKFVAGITNAKIGVEGLTKASKVGTMAVRGLSFALKAVGIGLAIEAISLLMDGIGWVTGKISEWVKGDADLIEEEKLLEAQLDYVNKKLEKRNEDLAKSYYQGAISQEEYFRKSLEETTDAINKQVAALKEKATLQGGSLGENLTKGLEKKEVSMSWGGGTREAENLEQLTELWKEYTEAVDDHTDAMSKYAEKTGSITAWFKSFMYTTGDTADDLTKIGQIAVGEFLKNYEHAMKTMVIDTKEGEKELEELKKSMDDNEMLRSVFMKLDQYIPVESFRKRIQQIIDLIRGVKTEMGDLEQRTVEQILRSEQLKIDAMKDGAEKRQAQRDLDKKKELADLTLTAEDKENIEKKYQQRKLKEEKEANKKLKSESDKHNREQLEAEKDLANLRIANMKEGLNKVLKQLEEERRLRLKKVETDGILVAERQAEINAMYDKKIIDAKKKSAEEIEKIEKDMWDNVLQYAINNQSKINNTIETALSTYRGKLERGRSQQLPAYVSSYGVQGVSRLSDETKQELQIEENKSKDIAAIYERRKEYTEKFWDELIETEKGAISTLYEAEIALENNEFEKRKSDNEKHYKELLQQQSDYIDKRKEELKGLARDEKWSQKELDLELLNADKEYQRAATSLYDRYKDAQTILQKEHETNLIKIREDSIAKTQAINGEHYRDSLQELRDFHTAINNLESKQPVINEWGITNFKETNKNNRILLDSYKKMAEDIVKTKANLQRELDADQISFDDFQSATRELDAFQEDLGEKMDKVKKDLSVGEQIGTFISDIQQYIQFLGQGLQTIMQSLWSAQDVMFDKEQEAIDKENDRLQKALDKNEEILERHSNNVNSIEDELSSARGDRRQHLIDQLNAEIAAEREAAAEKKRLEKEQEAQKKKEDALDKKRKEAQHNRDLQSIVVSGVMAVVNALATKPFVPVGLSMAALASALYTAQYAIAKSAKPYAHGGQLDGGVADGPRHSQGGIKVLGGRAEIEGGEFITNRTSTAKNIDLLEYVNSQKRKVDINDLIDFYSSGRPKKTVQAIRGRFAEGGNLPTLRTDIEVNDRLVSAFEDYAKTPSVVQVVDIIDRTKKVNNVKVLAGLSE